MSDQLPVPDGLRDPQIVFLPSSQRIGVGSLKSTFIFGLGNRAVTSPQKSILSRLMSDDIEVDNEVAVMYSEPYTLFLF